MQLPAVAGPAGAAVAAGPNVGQTWRVDQVSVTASAVCTCVLDVAGATVCASAAGNNDTAGGQPPLILRSSERLTVTWPDLPAGQTASAVILYETGY